MYTIVYKASWWSINTTMPPFLETVKSVVVFCQAERHVIDRLLQPSNLHWDSSELAPILAGLKASGRGLLPFFESNFHVHIFFYIFFITLGIHHIFVNWRSAQACTLRSVRNQGVICIQEAFRLSTECSVGVGSGGVSWGQGGREEKKRYLVSFAIFCTIF